MNSHTQHTQIYNIIGNENNLIDRTAPSSSAAIIRKNILSTRHSLELPINNLKTTESIRSDLILNATERMHVNENTLNESLTINKANPALTTINHQKLSAKSIGSANQTQSLRSQSLTTKNFFDYNFQTQQHMLILTNQSSSNNKNTQLDVYQVNQQQQQQQKLNTGGNNNPNLAINPHLQTHYNTNNSPSKIVNDSNKLLENILTNTKRKQTTSLNLLSPNNNTNTSNSNNIQNLSANFSNQVNLPPTVLTICRSNEERFLFPDKLILERRNLNACPIIEGDDQLKLINYQHNQIRSIQNLDQMKSLIFLDLYDNRIERITGLSSLINLRVLMLGKNRIEKVENLDALLYLDVLDLHGNQITNIENLSNLHELRVLNIAANQIKVVDNLNGLHSLVELNLRRNQIYEINELEHCNKLQRLFLSFNDIMSLMSIKNLNTLNSLQELSLDNNPISIEKNYKRNVLAQMISLKKLDSKKVTDEEKRIAERMFLKSEFKKRELENYYFLEEKRKTIIRDAKTEWFALQQSVDGKKEKTLLELNGKEPNIICLNGNELESKFVLPDDHNKIGHSNITFQKPTQSRQMSQNAILNYQNYLQQYQSQTQLSNANKINAKLKIVTMRNVNSQFPNQISVSNQNFNMISSSSSSSLHSNENDSKQIDSNTINEYNTNEEAGQISDYQRAQAILLSRSNSASSQISKTAASNTPTNNTNTNNTNNPTNQTNSASLSVSNIRRSITYNSGSNIHEDSIMYFYGVKSLELLDNKLENSLTAQITTISFHYIDYDENLCKNFTRIKFKFPSVFNLIFTCCNIKCLSQIDVLAEWKRLDSLSINKEDNPIYSISIWPHYTICRLNSLQLKKLNDKLISPEDVVLANKLLNTYLNWSLFLPEYKLLAILGQDKKKLIKIAKERCNDPNSVPTQEQINARETIIKAVSASNNQQFKQIVNNPLLQTMNQNLNQNQAFVNNVFSQMTYNDYKKQKIKSLENDIWLKVMNESTNLENKNKHLVNICEKKKIRF